MPAGLPEFIYMGDSLTTAEGVVIISFRSCGSYSIFSTRHQSPLHFCYAFPVPYHVWRKNYIFQQLRILIIFRPHPDGTKTPIFKNNLSRKKKFLICFRQLLRLPSLLTGGNKFEISAGFTQQDRYHHRGLGRFHL